MRTERNAQDTVSRTAQRRRTLSNITNLSLSASWVSDPREGLIAKTPSKTGGHLESQLREENTALKRFLAERDATIEMQAARLEQRRKEFFAQMRRQTEVNEELISYNSRLSKDGGQLRDQLKLLQHEYCQMTVAYRISQSELQLKLAESEELLARLLEQAEKSSTDQPILSKIPKRPRSASTQRRHSISNVTIEEDWNASVKLEGGRLPSSVSRETTAGFRQTQQQADNPPVGSSVRTTSSNVYSGLIGLDPMPEGSCEGDYDSPRASTSEEASSNNGEELCKGGKPVGGLPSESNSRRRKSSSTEPSGCGRRASGQFGNNTSKANLRVSSSGTSSVPTPHFSRRVAINSSLKTENGRPVRRAVLKISSYTEPSLNTKMRRPA